MSHAGEQALVAVALAREVGVDIELFSAGERNSRRIWRVAAFSRCWTRKASFVKARGDGLSFPLSGWRTATAASGGWQLICWDGKHDSRILATADRARRRDESIFHR